MTRKLEADEVKAAIEKMFDTLPVISRADFIAAIDSLAAAEEGGDKLLKQLQKGCRDLGAIWGSRGINERSIGIEPGYSPSAICREELTVFVRSLSASYLSDADVAASGRKE